MNKQLSIILTPAAKDHFKRITKENHAIKLSLKKSGCSGFAYSMDVAAVEDLSHYDQLFQVQDIKFIVPDNAIKAFENCIIDYKREGLNSKVVFDNPNAFNHCGCGESFALPT